MPVPWRLSFLCVFVCLSVLVLPLGACTGTGTGSERSGLSGVMPSPGTSGQPASTAPASGEATVVMPDTAPPPAPTPTTSNDPTAASNPPTGVTSTSASGGRPGVPQATATVPQAPPTLTTEPSSRGTAPSVNAPTTDGTVFPATVTTPRIMIVGDSISAGPGCYKKYLDQELQSVGITNYEFVGEYGDDCGGGIRHSAVSCTTSGQYTQETFTVPNCFADQSFPGMSTLVANHNPDLILLQLGVNDVWGGSAPVQPILDNYATLIEQARSHNPSIVVAVAQIHRIITDNCTNDASTTNAEQLVTALPGWAETVTSVSSPVFIADLWTDSDAHEADDCVHPNDEGAKRMALNWFKALEDILD